MKIQFYIRFYTRPGQSLAITGNSDALGNDEREKALPLHYLNNEYWQGGIDVDPGQTAKIRYSYLFRDEEGNITAEGGDRVIDITGTGILEIQTIDTWNDAGEYGNAFYTDPFQKVLLAKKEPRGKSRSPKTFTHIFKVKAPLLRKHESICLLGNTDLLGEWDTDSPILLNRENDWWSVKLDLSAAVVPLEYKYGIFNVKEQEFAAYESGGNRLLIKGSIDNQLTILHDGFARFPNNTWKGAGVSIPVFSLRSKNSFGVGEFADLPLLVDWARKTGLSLIQLLPVNDTTATHSWTDSYPYAAISVFALHPLYLNIEAAAGKRSHRLLKSMKKKQKQLNALPEIDYEQSLRFKLSAARELFIEQKEEFLKDPGFIRFFEDNRRWLIPYAAFCYLRDRNGTVDFNQWKLYSRFDRAAIEKYVSPKAKHYDNIAFTYFLQYHLHLQLTAAVEYAHKHGVVIKGDIPIGAYRYGCDVWMEPEFFSLEWQSGAPPDAFSEKGQNWGFPIYNWDRMSQDNFYWQRRRLTQMEKYFDAFRLDHILGFFRIWSIPADQTQGLMGRFIPAIPVQLYEFEQRGIWFDYERFCRPYITDEVLWELFGPNKDKFIPFLELSTEGHYQFKTAFDTQHKVEEYFKGFDDTEDNSRIREGLLTLLANLILFERQGSGGRLFDFRLGIENTCSFRRLDRSLQQRLKELYIDYFYRRQDHFWEKQAMKKLPALKQATNMLAFGEDLGMVPRCVPEVMKRLAILSLEVQRMPKDMGKAFSDPADAPYLSVVTPSTHDMSVIRAWWEEDKERTQRFFNEALGMEGEAPAQCSAAINTAIVRQHLASPAMWSIFQWQDLVGMEEGIRRDNPEEERINRPENPQHYWNYRMHISLENLLKEKEFNEKLKVYIEESRR
ncbi:MAG: 4-alpha-glucanotransferase [Chitinophagaceae bacterium]|nr:4-alpha-glucanotransferase [Chitinophagaceae bacterium]